MRPAASQSGFAPSIDDLVFVYDKVGLPEGRLRRDTASHNHRRCSCVEETKRERRNTLPRSGGEMSPSADIPHRGSLLSHKRHPWRLTRGLWNLSAIIRRLPEPLRVMLPFTCAACFEVVYHSWDDSVVGSALSDSIDPPSLNPNCIVCDIIQQIHRSTLMGYQSSELIVLYYGHNEQKPKHMQIDLDRGGGISTRVQLYTEGQDPHNPFPVSLLTVCSEPLSSPMASKIQGWIAGCMRDHERCSTNAVFIPKRLIRLEGDCRLESPKKPVEYAALSYCWGSVTPSATTKSNVTLRYCNLLYRQLPLTLQDAIVMTRMLGLKYLWIDSVCIVQDDEEDWAAEAANMGEIYSEAHVVLAATAGSSANHGLRQQRNQVQRFRSFVDPHHPIEVNARIVNNHTPSSKVVHIDDQPLSKRGWALQERVLARRTVHFLPDEVLFECRSGAVCECGYVQCVLPGHLSMAWIPDAERLQLHSVSDKNLLSRWQLFVREFTKRSLTFQKDTLPALSGIARRMLPLKPGRYFAGIWERGIAYQLEWVHASLTDWGTKYEGKPSQHRPTFSWVACPGPIDWLHISSMCNEAICTFVTGGSTPCAGDSYGTVKDVFIQLHAQSILGLELISEIENLGGKTTRYHPPTIFLDTLQCFPKNRYLYPLKENAFEGLDNACDWDSVICLGLTAFKSGKEEYTDRVSMLLLAAIPAEDVYVRIGIVTDFPLSHFDEIAIERTVTIV